MFKMWLLESDQVRKVAISAMGTESLEEDAEEFPLSLCFPPLGTLVNGTLQGSRQGLSVNLLNILVSRR